MATCTGNGDDHCCYLGDFSDLPQHICPFLEENTVPGRRWACGLYRQHGSWEAVYQCTDYITVLKPFFDAKMPGEACGTWPRPGETCNTCGITG